MKQKWYKKVTIQSALINAIPNLGIVIISIFTLIITLNISDKQISQNQNNFDKQYKKDSLLNVQQDSITKQKTILTRLQLEVLNKQFLNDSINNYRQLLIAKEEYDLNTKKKLESDLMNKENLSVKGISFLTYETKYQDNYTDSLYGFEPDIIYKKENNTISKNFQLLYRLVFNNIESDSEINNLPVLQTFNEAQCYMKERKINSKFKILKEFTIICDLTNNTTFPIKLLANSKNAIQYEGIGDSAFQKPQSGSDNNLVIYPGQKDAMQLSFLCSLDIKLNTSFILTISIDYETIFGKRNKTIKAHFSPHDKSFAIYD